MLQSEKALRALFERMIVELDLKPIGEPIFHLFPPPGGVTGFLLLRESHLACHSFPESGYFALNLYCCRPRPAWPFAARLAEHLGAARVEARAIDRPGPCSSSATP